MFGLHILVWRARFCLGQPQSFTTRYYGLGANTLPSLAAPPSIHFPQHRFSTTLSCTQRSRNNLYSSQFHRPRPLPSRSTKLQPFGQYPCSNPGLYFTMTCRYQLDLQDMLKEYPKSCEQVQLLKESQVRSTKFQNDCAHVLQLLVCETIEYPKVSVNDGNDDCQNPAVGGHVLVCGHLIQTMDLNEVCAPNCHHVAERDDELDNDLKISTKNFCCDACVNTKLESQISSQITLTLTDADRYRISLQLAEARKRQEYTRFRKCYVACKKSSVPCDSDGKPSSRYVPNEDHHPFDPAFPRIGANMFEDIDPAIAVADVQPPADSRRPRGENQPRLRPKAVGNSDSLPPSQRHSIVAPLYHNLQNPRRAASLRRKKRLTRGLPAAEQERARAVPQPTFFVEAISRGKGGF
jgi:hypothetical protein